MDNKTARCVAIQERTKESSGSNDTQFGGVVGGHEGSGWLAGLLGGKGGSGSNKRGEKGELHGGN